MAQSTLKKKTAKLMQLDRKGFEIKGYLHNNLQNENKTWFYALTF